MENFFINNSRYRFSPSEKSRAIVEWIPSSIKTLRRKPLSLLICTAPWEQPQPGWCSKCRHMRFFPKLRIEPFASVRSVLFSLKMVTSYHCHFKIFCHDVTFCNVAFRYLDHSEPWSANIKSSWTEMYLETIVFFFFFLTTLNLSTRLMPLLPVVTLPPT